MLKYYFTDEAIAAGLMPPVSGLRGRRWHRPARALRGLRAAAAVGHAGSRPASAFEIPSGYYGLICNRILGRPKGILPGRPTWWTPATPVRSSSSCTTHARPKPIHIEASERIAQIVIMPIYRGELHRIDAADVKAVRARIEATRLVRRWLTPAGRAHPQQQGRTPARCRTRSSPILWDFDKTLISGYMQEPPVRALRRRRCPVLG